VPTRRKTNKELMADLRDLVTVKFYAVDPADGRVVTVESGELDRALACTKPWRAELWRKLNEIDGRLVPRPGEPEPKEPAP